jgi:hypothetical protein
MQSIDFYLEMYTCLCLHILLSTYYTARSNRHRSYSLHVYDIFSRHVSTGILTHSPHIQNNPNTSRYHVSLIIPAHKADTQTSKLVNHFTLHLTLVSTPSSQHRTYLDRLHAPSFSSNMHLTHRQTCTLNSRQNMHLKSSPNMHAYQLL